jgi:hypothetical protein
VNCEGKKGREGFVVMQEKLFLSLQEAEENM